MSKQPTAPNFPGDEKLKGKADEKRTAALTPTLPPLGNAPKSKKHPAAR